MTDFLSEEASPATRSPAPTPTVGNQPMALIDHVLQQAPHQLHVLIIYTWSKRFLKSMFSEKSLFNSKIIQIIKNYQKIEEYVLQHVQLGPSTHPSAPYNVLRDVPHQQHLCHISHYHSSDV